MDYSFHVKRARVENFLAWVRTGAAALPSNGMTTDLRELAEANVWDIDCSNRGQTFTIRYTIYSCHSFTNDMDYYLISQSGQLNSFWIKVDDVEHRDWIRRYVGFRVPLKCPPRMVLSTGQMDFAAGGESKTVTFVSARDWTASSDAEWCGVQETSGKATGPEGLSLHITVSPYTSGANRTATVTMRETDGREICVLKVFQSQY